MSDSEFVLYLRRSQGKAGIPRQDRECRTHAERIGAAITRVFKDEDATAYVKPGARRAKRDEGYAPMLEMLRRTPGLGVLAWHADRLHRDPAEAEDFIAVCATGHNPVETPRSGSYDLTTPTGRKRFRNDAVDAAYEVDHMIERWESQKSEAARAGQWLGGRRPTGFEADGVTVREAEAALIAAGSEQLLVGVSLNQIARDWTAAGFTTSGGKRWRPEEVRRVLVRARNAGIAVHRGVEVGRAVWPAIVPEDTWRAVVAVLSDPSRRTSPGPERRWLGSGLYLCGVCGLPAKVGSGGDARGTRPVYRCREDKHIVRDAPLLDGFVEETLVAWLARPEAADLLAPAKGKRDEVKRLHVRAMTLRASMTEAREMWTEDEITRAEYVEKKARLEARLADVQRLIDAAAEVNALTGLAGNPQVGELWPSLSLSRRRAVLQALAVVTIKPAPKGRPPGWRPGEPYFNPAAIDLRWL